MKLGKVGTKEMELDVVGGMPDLFILMFSSPCRVYFNETFFSITINSVMKSLRQFKVDTRQNAVPKNGISRASRNCRRQVGFALQKLAPCQLHLHTNFILLTQPRLSNITHHYTGHRHRYAWRLAKARSCL